MVQNPGLAGTIRIMKLNEILAFKCLDALQYRTQKCKENPKSVSFMMHSPLTANLAILTVMTMDEGKQIAYN
jgi:hypothetical protein